MARSPYGTRIVHQVTATERRARLADDRKALAEFRAMTPEQRVRMLEALRRMAQ